MSRDFGKRSWSIIPKSQSARADDRRSGPDEETRQLIIAAAREEFHASGYAGASMVRVAQRAGVSTKTMYRLIPTKADLFQSIVSDRISRFILEIDDEHARRAADRGGARAHPHFLWQLDPRRGDDLATFAWSLPSATAFRRSPLPSSSSRIRRTTQTMERWLKRQRDRGRIAIDDAVDGGRHAQGHDDHGTAARADARPAHAAGPRPRSPARARYCARLFLDGCRR